MAGRLEGKVAIITGAGGGQGRAASLRFTAEGAAVIGCDVDADANEETIAAVKAAGHEMTAMAPVDLGDPEQVWQWVEEAAAVHGRIDIVYNNAARVRTGPIPDFSIEDWQYTIRNDLDLVFYVTKYAWPYLAKRGGVIINTASAIGWVGWRNVPFVAHAAAKGGVIAMTRQMAVEGAPYGIRAVSISPGPIESPSMVEMYADPVVRDPILAQNLIKRLGQPDDIAGVAVFLATDDASFITGEDIKVDGGWTTT